MTSFPPVLATTSTTEFPLAFAPLVAAPAVPVPLAVLGFLATLGVFYIALRRGLGSNAYRLRMLSPERIAAHRPDGSGQTVEGLAASISERANAICQAVSEDSSEVRAEMCAMGYRRCADDMITLTHRLNEEAGASPLARRVRMRRARKRAVEALDRARNCLPAEALKATRQEK
ncbi:hypothetical protein [Rubrobacter indicoceani]|uniref:hypothetical protein n=1 Tax=Rubrobacter indicoceani TaxID=2051957 RepID=UPI000E5A67F7|nr:hypothetical protein [Rubrobacter indicoceani]